MSRLPPLRIGDIVIDPPILQGAMGAYISLYNLASAVSNEGALGVITSVGLGEYTESYQDLSYEERSDRSLKDIIAETRKRTDRPFGVNIMYALTNHDNLVRVCVEEKVPIIVSGAGLPLKLPSLVSGSACKMIPVVSSGRAADLICRTWRKKFNIYPDAFIVEGPLAGGHLGYSYEELENINNISLERIFMDVKKAVQNHSERIPIIVGGGIFSGYDIAKFLKIGASGVQMATRFIATFECDASDALKEEVVRSGKEDVVIIKSPVKMPGRVIRNKFVDKIIAGERIDFDCKYKCLKTCDVKTVNYCIAKALVNAFHGNMSCGFVMAGANCYRVNKVVHVKELIHDLVREAEERYFADQACGSYSVG